MITLELDRVRRAAASRKMDVDTLIGDCRIEGETVQLDSAERLEVLTTTMILGAAALGIEAETASDLDDGVRICRRRQGFTRTVQRSGTDYYTYEHLATSNDAPELMALKVTLHCNDVRSITPNAGHETKELIYVLDGDVRMDWTVGDATRTATLAPGDSVYLTPDVPHSFIATGTRAEIIAVNYGRW